MGRFWVSNKVINITLVADRSRKGNYPTILKKGQAPLEERVHSDSYSGYPRSILENGD